MLFSGLSLGRSRTWSDRRGGAIAAGGLLAVALSPAALGQWTAHVLHPAGSGESLALAAGAGQQAGFVNVGQEHASAWSGSAGSLIDLHPAGAMRSRATSAWGVAGGGEQAGWVILNGEQDTHASVWRGSAASWVDLHPGGMITRSIALGAGDGFQVGYVRYPLNGGFAQHASMWNGDAASWVDLNPPGTNTSQALAVNNGQQVGWTFLGNSRRASLWHGTAASRVDLHPASAMHSEAWGVGSGQQVGYVEINGAGHLASVWNDTASSWVNLNPANIVFGEALAASGGHQVGMLFVDFVNTHAMFWSGTAASRVDLHPFLPAQFEFSRATGIARDTSHLYVTGWGRNGETAQIEALLWTACAADFNLDGVGNSADFFDYIAAFFSATPAGDFNGSDGVTSQDFFDFLTAFFTGC